MNAAVGTLRNLRRDLARLGDQRILRHAAIDESELRGFDARQQSSGVDQLERAMRSQARDEKRMAARVEHCADTRERRSDLRVVGDIDDVASQREAEAHSQARAMNGGEGRRGERDDSLDQRIESRLDYRFGVFVARMRVREIAARAERRPFAANHHRAHALRRRALEGAVEFGDHRVVQRVHLVGPVENNFRETVFDRQIDAHIGGL